MATIGYRPEQSVIDLIDKLGEEKMWSRNKVVSHIVKQYFTKPAKESRPAGTGVVVAGRKKAPAKRFVKPEWQELAVYFNEQGSLTCQDDATAFIDHYTGNGWKAGKNPMKDWKASVRNWMRGKKNEKAKSNGITSGPTITAHDNNF